MQSSELRLSPLTTPTFMAAISRAHFVLKLITFYEVPDTGNIYPCRGECKDLA